MTTTKPQPPDDQYTVTPPNRWKPPPLVSGCANAFATECRCLSPAAVLRDIRGQRWQMEVERIRATKGKWGPAGEAGQWKRQLSTVLWSGTFSRRSKDALVRHSGLLVADLDDLIPGQIERARTAFVADPHTFAAFVSPSGRGLKAVFRIPAEASRHGEAFKAVASLVKRLTGLEVAALRDASFRELVENPETAAATCRILKELARLRRGGTVAVLNSN